MFLCVPVMLRLRLLPHCQGSAGELGSQNFQHGSGGNWTKGGSRLASGSTGPVPVPVPVPEQPQQPTMDMGSVAGWQAIAAQVRLTLCSLYTQNAWPMFVPISSRSRMLPWQLMPRIA